MSATIAECLERARQCEWYASRTSDEGSRKFLLWKAQQWMRLVETIQPGAGVRVRYCPGSPERSMLITGVFFGSFFLPAMGLMFFVTGIGLLMGILLGDSNDWGEMNLAGKIAFGIGIGGLVIGVPGSMILGALSIIDDPPRRIEFEGAP